MGKKERTIMILNIDTLYAIDQLFKSGVVKNKKEALQAIKSVICEITEPTYDCSNVYNLCEQVQADKTPVLK